MIRVMLVDDQAVIREGLRSMLSPEASIVVVGEAADGQQALERVTELAPDVVLLDVRMPGMDGLTALDRIKAVAPRASVLMVTLYDDPDYLLRAVSAGAAGYVLKDTSRDDLIRAIRVVADGGAIVAPAMLPELLSRLTHDGSDASPRVCSLTDGLTERELEVLRLVAEGMTNRQIAAQLIVSPLTVKTHVQSILDKLNVSDRTQAAVYAVRCGIV